MIWILLLLGALTALVFTVPGYVISEGDVVIWEDRVWTVVYKRRRKYTLMRSEDLKLHIEYRVPKRHLTAVSGL